MFDRVLIEYIIDRYSTGFIDVAVKAKPVLNDAMIPDAVQVGLNRIKGVNIVEIDPYETEGISRDSEEFYEFLNEYDLIISKGQANYEYLGDISGIFFLFMVKCEIVARDLSEKIGIHIVNGDTILWQSHGI